MTDPRCSACGGRCLWCEDAWVCRACGSEWDEDHGVRYLPPAEQPEWEPVWARPAVNYIVYWRLRFRGRSAGSIARLNESGGSATNNADTVAWRAIGYPITGASLRGNTPLGEHGSRRSAEAAVLAHWEAIYSAPLGASS